MQSEAFEAALSDRGIAYQVRGNARFFARADVRKAMVLLRGGARAVDPDLPMPDAVRDILRNAGWSESPPEGRGAARERWDALQALVDAGRLARCGAADGQRSADRRRPGRRARRARRPPSTPRPSRA